MDGNNPQQPMSDGALHAIWQQMQAAWASMGERGRAMAAMSPSDQWRAFASGALNYGPMALGSRGGAAAMSRTGEHQAPNPAIMDRMRQGHFDRTDDPSVWQ